MFCFKRVFLILLLGSFFAVRALAANLDFDQQLELQEVKFHVTCSAGDGSHTLTITPAGLKLDNAPITRAIGGTVKAAEVADLNVDGSPEIYVYVTKSGPLGGLDLIAYAANKRKSLSEIHLPALTESKRASKGYQGGDEFAVVESILARRFLVYASGEPGAKPSGMMRQVQYRLAAGEAGWRLRIDRITDFEAPAPAPATQDAVTTVSASAGESGGLDLQFLSSKVKPGDDFFRYVNEGWLETAVMPQGLPMIDAFTEVALRAEDQVEDLVHDLASTHTVKGSPEQQIADLYASYMNMKRRNEVGFTVLKPEVEAILALADRSAVAASMGKIAYGSIIQNEIEIDDAHPERYVLLLNQSGLGMPSRDFYLKEGEPYAGYREAYVKYITTVLERSGVNEAGKQASAVFEFEKSLADKHWTPEATRDPVKSYHVMPTGELATYAPGFDWAAYLKELGYEHVVHVQLATDSALRDEAAIFARTDLASLRAYLVFHYVSNHAGLMSSDWEALYFEFFMHKLMGVDQQRPLDKRAVNTVNGLLGEQVGRLYVQRYFPPESKAQIEELVGFLTSALGERLQTLEWMDEATRAEAQAKLKQFRVKVGYPDHWRDFSSIDIQPDDLVGNVHRIAQWARADNQAKLNEPKRMWEWLKNPHEINAYYSPNRNEIVFPAGILQPPFFDPKADPAVNFGSIGAVIGHEIGHGFDDQGSQYDGTGKLRNWWSAQSLKNYQVRTAMLTKQYDGYEPIKGLHVNGKLTLGENIGDLGGVAMAFNAYQKYAAAKYPGGKAPELAGFDANQRFFLGFARLWRCKMTDAVTRQLALTDPHSPSQYRVNGVLRNFDPWYEAFGVASGEALYLPSEERVAIW